MRYKMLNKYLTRMCLALLAVSLMAGPSFAYTIDLAAVEAEWTPPGGVPAVPMWAFIPDPGFCPGAPVPWDVGPRIVVPTAEGLTINLRNCLSEEVSIVIPGQAMPSGSAPVYHTAGPYTGRVRSFTSETPPDGTTVVPYTWGTFDPGTYVYHSGTHPQVQVQMGLYGPARKDQAASAAYAGVTYDKELSLLFSEIDRDLHDAVDDGSYGTPPGPTSTIHYNPRYFLINGDVFDASSPSCITLDLGSNMLYVNDDILIRMMNAGLREIGPMLLGGRWSLVAEGGNKYQFSKNQYSVLLPAMGTRDAIFSPDRDDDYFIVERRMNITNAAATGGGQQTCITVAPTGGIPIADLSNGEPYSGTVGSPITFDGSLSSDDGAITAYAWNFGDAATATCPGDPGCSGATVDHTYSSPGTYAVSLVVTDDAANDSAPDTTNATVSPADGTPAADAGGPYSGKVGFPITLDGSGSTDDGAIVQYEWDVDNDATFDISTGDPTAEHTYTAAYTGDVVLRVTDNFGNTDTDTAGATVIVNSPPTASLSATNTTPGSAEVTLDACTSNDPDGDTLTYTWYPGDGTIETTVDPDCDIVHVYPVAATYTATVVVDDGFGGSDTDTASVTVEEGSAPDTLTCIKADYKVENDRLSIEVRSDDMPAGMRTITGVVDRDGDGFGDADDYDVGTIPVKNPGSDVYRTVVQPFPDPNPTEGVSMFRATSDLGGECTIPVN